MKARKEVSQIKATARKKSIGNQDEAKAIDVYSSKAESGTSEGYFPKEIKENQDEEKDMKLDEPKNQAIIEKDNNKEQNAEELYLDNQKNDHEVEIAATRIQAGFKGMQVRKNVSAIKDEITMTKEKILDKETSEKCKRSKNDNEEELGMELPDPEVQIAATKIQAGFKGMKARKEVSAMKGDFKHEIAAKDLKVEERKNKNRNDNEEKIDLDILNPKHGISEKDSPKLEERNDNAEDIDINLLDPEVEIAATKIQAGFKGMKARKQVSAMKEDYKNEIVVKDLPKVEERKNKDRNNIKEEEIDIDLLDPEVEMAATKIQAGFKGMKARKGVSAMKLERHDVDEKDVPKVKERNKNRNDNEEQKKEFENNEIKESNTKFNEGIVDIDLLDPEVESAATKIQAGFKGMKARKEVSALKGKPRHEIDEKDVLQLEEWNKNRNYNEEESNIDLLDPEVEIAATKIQAGFKGMKARKDLSAMRGGPKHELEENDIPEDERSNKKRNGSEEGINIDLLDPEVEIAATKIQAGFKGMKARQEVSARKGEPKLEEKDKLRYEENSKKRNEKEVEIGIDYLDPEVENEFKGMKTRKEIPVVIRDCNHEIAEEARRMLEEGNRNENMEEIDNNLLDPEVEIATTKVQTGFKGGPLHQIDQMDAAKFEERNENRNDVKEPKQESGDNDKPKVVESNTNFNDEEIDIDLLDPEVEIAATKIQAGFKGMKARKEVFALKGKLGHEFDEKDASKFEERNKNRTNIQEEIDIDLLDPEVEIAATKIQAGFKGMKARKEVSAMKGSNDFLENHDVNISDPAKTTKQESEGQ